MTREVVLATLRCRLRRWINRGLRRRIAVKPTHATVTLCIENHYEFHKMVVVISTVTVPLPPDAADVEATDEWAYEYIFKETGTRHYGSDSWYFVEIIESTAPELIGRKFEFGL